MKSLFPTSNKSVETVLLDGDHKCDVYVWNSPEGVKIATHMILPCPQCGYPLSVATSEFDFDAKTLMHELKCPARWKKVSFTDVGARSVRLAELNEKGKPVIQRCGWRGYIIEGELISES